jgi:hypothetical protein
VIRVLCGATAAVVLACVVQTTASDAATNLTAAPVVHTSAPAGLTVHVQLGKSRVRIGHRLRVNYTWSDGNGDLVDTNNIGTMAVHVERNVPCKRTGSSAHPIHGHGTWWYRPVAAFTGAFTAPVKIRVGFNVRTGGCAPIEERTTTQIVKVLPALTD